MCVIDYICLGGDENGIIAPRAGIEPTSLAFCAIVLTITPARLPDVTTLPTVPGGSVPERAVQITTLIPPGIVSLLNGHSMLTIIYIQAMHLHIYVHKHRVGSTAIQHITCTGSWSQQTVS